MKLRLAALFAAMAAAAAIALQSCSTSKVGGQFNRANIAGQESESLNAYCDGRCMAFSASGSCVRFSSDISDVCISHFTKAARINGDCSPYIDHVSGDVTVTYNSKC